MTVAAAEAAYSSDRLSEKDWNALIRAIELKLCTPFLGSGACYGLLPTGTKLAEKWANEKDVRYPFKDIDNLPRVAQYVAVNVNPLDVRNRILQEFSAAKKPDFTDPYEIHALVARMSLRVYITTNYDDFMFRALEAQQGLRPFREVCRWRDTQSRRRTLSQAPSLETPLVYHLHGSLEEPEQMVITEDDYLDFLISVTEDDRLILPHVKKALANSTLLFLGYSLEDLDFKLLFRRIARWNWLSGGAQHVAVQLVPEGDKPTLEELEAAHRRKLYLEQRYNKGQSVKMYWGTCQEFAKELAARWRK